MKRWALIVDGAVSTVIEQLNTPSIPGAWVDCTGSAVGPGMVWSGSAFFPPVAAVYTRITTPAFWDRFTNNELVNYDVAMQHDPAATTPAKKAAAKLRIFMRDANNVGWLRLGATKVVSFVADLETQGVLASGRAAEITGAAISEAEAAILAESGKTSGGA